MTLPLFSREQINSKVGFVPKFYEHFYVNIISKRFLLLGKEW